GGALGGGATGHGHVLAGVLDLQLAVAAGGRDELELLVRAVVARPLVDGRAGGGAVAVAVQAEAVADDGQRVVAGGVAAAGAAASSRAAGDGGGAVDADGVDDQVAAAGFGDLQGVRGVAQPTDAVEGLLGLVTGGVGVDRALVRAVQGDFCGALAAALGAEPGDAGAGELHGEAVTVAGGLVHAVVQVALGAVAAPGPRA